MVIVYNAQGYLDGAFGKAGIALATVPGNTTTYGLTTSTPSFADGKVTVAWDTGFGGGAGFDLFRYSVISTATVSGTVFNDLNGDGVRQIREPGLAGAFVYADITNVGYYVVGDPTASTDANGKFAFTGLDSGAHSIRIKPAAGLHQTDPSGASAVTLFSNSMISGLLFGEAKTSKSKGTGTFSEQI